jgi:hypothetical protein
MSGALSSTFLGICAAADRAEGFGFRASSYGCMVSGFASRVQRLWFRASGFPTQTAGERVEGRGMSVDGAYSVECGGVRTVSGRAHLGREQEVIYIDSGYWAISGSIHPKGDPAS